MFQGWSDNIPGITSGWDDYNWNLTNASRCPLIAKDRIYKIPHTQVKKGDIIYTYDDGENTHYEYTHVCIAAADYNASTGTCLVHGHTENKQNWAKPLTADNCRCYRVKSAIKVEASEKRVSPMMIGNGADVI